MASLSIKREHSLIISIWFLFTLLTLSFIAALGIQNETMDIVVLFVFSTYVCILLKRDFSNN
jgi:hypothetical protein